MTDNNEVNFQSVDVTDYDPFEDQDSDYYEDSEIKDDYDLLHQKIIDYLVSGELHSTIVGMIAVLDGDKSKNDFIEATLFADYIIGLLKKVNNGN